MENNGKQPVVKVAKKRNFKRALFIVLALVLILGIGAVSGYAATKKLSPQTAEAISAKETSDLVNAVSKLMVLPTDETPSVATVTDKDKLKDQPFFANSENGDKVLIYTNAKKAILYRPSTDKLVEVMPIAFNDNSQAVPAPTTTPAPAPAPAKK